MLKKCKKIIIYNKNLKRMSKHFYLIIGASILFKEDNIKIDEIIEIMKNLNK